MDVKYVNIFLETFAKTMPQFGINDLKRGNIAKKTSLSVDSDVSAILTFKNGLLGNIAISMSQGTALNLVSAMMMGMSIPTIDDTAKSAIGEILSIIGGAASTMSVSQGIAFQSACPSVILGPATINTLETLAIDFESQIGKIVLSIGVS